MCLNYWLLYSFCKIKVRCQIFISKFRYSYVKWILPKNWHRKQEICQPFVCLTSVSISVLLYFSVYYRVLIAHRLPFQVFIANKIPFRSCQFKVQARDWEMKEGVNGSTPSFSLWASSCSIKSNALWHPVAVPGLILCHLPWFQNTATSYCPAPVQWRSPRPQHLQAEPLCSFGSRSVVLVSSPSTNTGPAVFPDWWAPPLTPAAKHLPHDASSMVQELTWGSCLVFPGSREAPHKCISKQASAFCHLFLPLFPWPWG